MIELTWDPIVVTAVMLFGAAIAYILFAISRKIIPPKPSVQKMKTYACGEEIKPEETHMDSEQFFSPVHRVLKSFYRYIRPAHTGVISTYLFWVVTGFVFILIVILLVLTLG